MKKTLLLLSCAMMAGSLWADDLTRAIQQRLKDQGFYYGEVDGQGGDETSAAIRRYQIRYGLRVTGQLNDETLHSLHLSRDSLAQPAPGYQDNGGPSNRQPESQYHQQPPYQQAPYQQPPREDYGQPVPQRPGPEDYDEAQPAPIFSSRSRDFLSTAFRGNDLRTGAVSDPRECALCCAGRIDEKRLFPGRHRRAPGSGNDRFHFTASTGRGAAHEWEA